MLCLPWFQVVHLLESFEHLWRPVLALEVNCLRHFKIELGYLRAHVIAFVANVEGNRLVVLVDTEVHILEASIGETVTEGVGRL